MTAPAFPTAANALYESIASIVHQHTVEHAWVCAGTIAADSGLLLDQAMGQPLYHYGELAALTLPDPIATVNVTDSHGDTLTVTVPRPAALAPPVPGDRVAVLMVKTRSDDALDDGPLLEAWVLGRMVAIDVDPNA